MNISYYQNGERADATVLNRPLVEISNEIDAVNSTLSNKADTTYVDDQIQTSENSKINPVVAAIIFGG